MGRNPKRRYDMDMHQDFFIADEQLKAHGEALALGLHLCGTVSARALCAELRGRLRNLRHRSVALQTDGNSLIGAAEWLADNWYLAQREGLSACESLSRSGRLRAVEKESMLFLLCRELVHIGNGRVTEARCRLFLDGIQQVRVLTHRELNQFPHLLRAALIFALEQESRAPDSPGAEVRVKRLFTSLRLFSTLNIQKTLEAVDRAENQLREDPAGVYPNMDEATRGQYRRQVEKLSRQFRMPEYQIAARARNLAEKSQGQARHVGWWLFVYPLGQAPLPGFGGIYMICFVLLTLFLSLLTGVLLETPWATLLLLLPVSELVKNALDFIVLRTTPPKRIPRMALENGVPSEGRTLCVVSVLLTGISALEDAVRRLEEYRLANRDSGENLLFGILADLPESTVPEHLGEQDLLLHGDTLLQELNVRYGGFYFLVRERCWDKTDKIYRGWERKRGAILELCRLLRGISTSIHCRVGTLKNLQNLHYVLTLDGDTRLCPGTAREMIGAMLHPLNHPEIDPQRRVVIRGHGILQPRMAVELSAADYSDFTRLFAGQGGTDPYCTLAGELYMSLWGWSSFSGKGILDIDAFSQCLEGEIPPHKVLSHDILEGAYLRCGYLGDVELTDGFPSNAPAYFQRLHRWVRGDWQNFPWLFGRGQKLPRADRWKIVDNLRRSLLPPAIFLSIFFGLVFGGTALLWVTAAAGFTLLSQLLLDLTSTMFRKEEEVRVRYHSTLFHGTGGSLMQTAVRLLLLPYEAWVCLSAICITIWRMTVTRRDLLAWQTAAQAEQHGKSLSVRCWQEMWPALIPALLALLLSHTILGRTAGLLWALSPVWACFLSRPRNHQPPISLPDRNYLSACAAEIWLYFRRFCTVQDHFLPPDNFQSQPPVGIAHRTSPTNLGLGLVSCLNALDLGLAPAEEVFSLLENMLSTMEQLEKWQGHFYNWYDTRSLRPLPPRYVSTVDSGNLCGCLIALEQGLREYDRADLADRILTLRRSMDFRPLYDSDRQLFHIGLNTETGKLDAGYYDLLASEARLTAYVAIAQGDVDRRHWRRLSRAQVSLDGYRGMASWTGTMFEYLMPELFLACRPNSLLYESARFCLFAQKRRVAKGKPWGISESAYSALDQDLSYRYKAHGCASLALKRGMDQELVISPYSSFLALELDRRSVLRNLHRMESKYGMRGEYGFWEALDCTPSRCGRHPKPVYCVMSHHLGMSMLAIANCLCKKVNQRRFLSNPSMAAYRCLLEERVPLGGILLHHRDREPAQRTMTRPPVSWRQIGQSHPSSPLRAGVLSNGVYNIMTTNSGLIAAKTGGIAPYRPPAHPGDLDGGLHFFWTQDETAFPLLPSAESGYGEINYVFSDESHTFSGNLPSGTWEISITLPSSLPGEQHQIFLQSKDSALHGKLVLEFEPLLAKYNDYVNHKAFWRLGRQILRQDNCLLVRRLARGSTSEHWLCLAATHPFTVPDACLGWPTNGSLHVAFPVALEAGDCLQIRLCLCLENTADSALSGARKGLTPDHGSALPQICAGLYGMDNQEIAQALDWLPALWFPRPCDTASAGRCVSGREALWKLGISGDLPLLVFSADNEKALPLCHTFLKLHAFLRNCGISADLVLCSGEEGSYLQPRTASLRELLRQMDLEAISGTRGGVHILSCSLNEALLAAPGIFLNQREISVPARQIPVSSHKIEREKRRSIPAYQFLPDSTFTFQENGSLPPRSWTNLLTNGHLSWLAADAGVGHLWYENARECPILPWENEPQATSGPEELFWIFDGREHSLFASPGDGICTVTYGPGWAQWSRRWNDHLATLTACIPLTGSRRLFLLELQGDGEILWHLPVVLAPDALDRICVQYQFSDGIAFAKNPRCLFPGLRFFACGSLPPTDYNLEHGITLRFPGTGQLVLSCGCDSPGCPHWDEAQKLLSETRSHWQALLGRIQVETPIPALNHMLNTWAPYAALACRCLGRSSLYQSGGAIGFRDQLQDTVNLILLDPALAREQLLSACRHQFQEGDVLHWWHPLPTGDRGVRTRCSDDLLWLPWALGEYVSRTGDRTILTDEVPWLSATPLAHEEENRYDHFPTTEDTDSVLTHACRALELALSRGTGDHGLLYFGDGDWNDGMDQIRGESAWLTWFAALAARTLAPLAENDRYLRAAAELETAANAAWDGAWYLRGWFPDGTPLGGAAAPACQLDSLSQSFAALSPGADPQRVQIALDSAIARLFDPKTQLVKLFDPPFRDAGPNPGYIRSYGPGFRENGGQYTHGAIWLAMACLRNGRTEDGLALLTALLPESHSPLVYQGEPYVLAADIYAAPGHVGEAGWTWYTGSAAWFWRVCLEDLLGFTRENGKLVFRGRLPSSWPSYTIHFLDTTGKSHYFSVTDQGTTLDNVPYDGSPLSF